MAAEDTRGGRSTTETARLVGAALVAVVLLVFALANTDETRVDYLAGTTDAPLIVVMVASALAGALIAALVRMRRR